MSPAVSVEPMPAAARAQLAAVAAIFAEVTGKEAQAAPTHRVAVRDCFHQKEHLKAASYEWDPDSRAWWTPLREEKALTELQARAGAAAPARAAAMRPHAAVGAHPGGNCRARGARPGR